MTLRLNPNSRQKPLLPTWGFAILGQDVVIFNISNMAAVVRAGQASLNFWLLSCTFIFQSASVPGLTFSKSPNIAKPCSLAAIQKRHLVYNKILSTSLLKKLKNSTMKYLLFALFFFIGVIKSYSQEVTRSGCKVIVEVTKLKKSKMDSITVEIKSFSGVDSSWVRVLKKNLVSTIRLDKKAKKGSYIISVRFIISKDGISSDILCENDPGFELGNQVVSVIKKSPRWPQLRP